MKLLRGFYILWATIMISGIVFYLWRGYSNQSKEMVEVQIHYDSVDIETRDNILKNLQFQALENETHNRKVKSYSVNAKGEIAVYSKMVRNKSEVFINVYSSEGKFLYGCQFQYSSGTYSIAWDGSLYILRTNSVYRLDETGNCVEIGELDRQTMSYTTIGALIDAADWPVKTINGITYKKKGSSKIVRIEDGEEIVVVDLKR